jgi:hypothetical protein
MGGLYRRLVEVEKEGDGKETLGDWARWEGNGMGRLYQEIGWDWKGRWWEGGWEGDWIATSIDWVGCGGKGYRKDTVHQEIGWGGKGKRREGYIRRLGGVGREGTERLHQEIAGKKMAAE